MGVRPIKTWLLIKEGHIHCTWAHWPTSHTFSDTKSFFTSTEKFPLGSWLDLVGWIEPVSKAGLSGLKINSSLLYLWDELNRMEEDNNLKKKKHWIYRNCRVVEAAASALESTSLLKRPVYISIIFINKTIHLNLNPVNQGSLVC